MKTDVCDTCGGNCYFIEGTEHWVHNETKNNGHPVVPMSHELPVIKKKKRKYRRRHVRINPDRAVLYSRVPVPLNEDVHEEAIINNVSINEIVCQLLEEALQARELQREGSQNGPEGLRSSV